MSTQKSNPLRGGSSEGVLLCLLALAVFVKPLADVVGNHICSDSHQEAGQNRYHYVHLLSVARLEKGSEISITQDVAECKYCRNNDLPY